MRTKMLALTLVAALATGASTAPASAQTRPAASANWTSKVERTAQGYRMGNPAAPLKLVEYGSRTCPACKRFSDQGMATLKARYIASGKVSYEFRDFLVHGAPDLAAALVGRCGSPSTFFPILEANFATQTKAVTGIQSTSAAERASVAGKPVSATLELIASRGGYVAQAQAKGVSLAQAKACLRNKAETDRLVAITDKTPESMVPGTPSFILNGKRIDGSGWATVEQALKRAGA